MEENSVFRIIFDRVVACYLYFHVLAFSLSNHLVFFELKGKIIKHIILLSKKSVDFVLRHADGILKSFNFKKLLVVLYPAWQLLHGA
ncbi:hypothetical protein D3C78_1483470 [compost metagenome]